MRKTLRPRHQSTNRAHQTFDTPPKNQYCRISNRQSHPKTNLSLGNKLHMVSPLKEKQEYSQNPEFFFDKSKRKSYMKNIIDNYFPMKSLSKQQDEKIFLKTFQNGVRRKDVFSSEGIKRQKVMASFPESKILAINMNSMFQGSGLPTIQESGFIKRPISQHRSQRTPVLKQSFEQEDSIFNDSSRSIMDTSKAFSQEIQLENRSYKTIISRDQGKRTKIRVFSCQNDQQLLREKMIKKLGYPIFWHQVEKNTFSYPHLKNIRQKICSIVESKNGQDPLFLIYPKDYYFSLFSNNCEELMDIIRGSAKLIDLGKGQVACNQLTLQNLYKLSEKDYRILDWGCAAVKEKHRIQGKDIQNAYQPYCRSQARWLIAPEYLSPEMLRAIDLDSYPHLWSQEGGIGACDVWSLGCLIFEIITLIPIYQAHHCVIKGDTHSKRGLMGVKVQNIESLLLKQKHFRSMVLRRLKEYIGAHQLGNKISPKILELLPRMLQEDPKRRVKVSQILKILQ